MTMSDGTLSLIRKSYWRMRCLEVKVTVGVRIFKVGIFQKGHSIWNNTHQFYVYRISSRYGRIVSTLGVIFTLNTLEKKPCLTVTSPSFLIPPGPVGSRPFPEVQPSDPCLYRVPESKKISTRDLR